MICSRCRRKGHVGHWPRPLTGEIVALCPRCVMAAFLEHVNRLVAAHG